MCRTSSKSPPSADRIGTHGGIPSVRCITRCSRTTESRRSQEKRRKLSSGATHVSPNTNALSITRPCARAVTALVDKVRRNRLPLHLMPARFTLTDLQQTCEAILGTSLDKSVFRRRIKEDASIQMLLGEFVHGPQRPAQLYRAIQLFHF